MMMMMTRVSPAAPSRPRALAPSRPRWRRSHDCIPRIPRSQARRYLYPHLHFQIGYNTDQVVSVNVSTFPQRKVDITEELDNTEIAFSFSVRAPHHERLIHALASYTSYTSFIHDIHLINFRRAGGRNSALHTGGRATLAD